MANNKESEGEFLPVRVSIFDQLIGGGLERGSCTLISGGCGVGKTIFAIQSAYTGALNGEKAVYLSLTEDPPKLKRHMKRNFNWDIDAMEKKGLIHMQRVDPFELARDIENMLTDPKAREKLSITSDVTGKISLIDTKRIGIPFKPDRIIVDSLSSLEVAFTTEEHYRVCIQLLVEALNQHNSVNFLISETEQEPTVYSRIGIEEFLVDGVIVLYNIRKGQLRRRAIEILKLRSSDHLKEMIPYMITENGIKILRGEKI